MWNVKQNSCFGLRFRFSLGSCNIVPLHQPVEVEVLERTFNEARDLCFIDGASFIAEGASYLIHFIDLEG